MDTDMVLDTIEVIMVDTTATPTTARGLLMPRLPPLLTPRPTPTWCIATTVLVVTTAATMVATLTTTTARDLLMLSPLLMPRLIPGMDTTDLHTTVTATHTTDMATATTGASKKGTSNPELTTMKCQHFDDDLPNILNFREESKRTKQNTLLLQTHCI